MHCPFWSVFLHCPSLAPCHVLPFWAMLCLPLLVSVLCTDHNGHCAYALPFWGTVLCTAPFGLCSALPLCALCSALLLFLGCIFTVLLGALCSVHCPSGSVCSVVPIMHSPSGLFCTTPLGTVLCTTPMFGLCSHCPSRSTLLCALPFWGTFGALYYSEMHCALHWLRLWTALLEQCALPYPSWALCFCTAIFGALCSAVPLFWYHALHSLSWALLSSGHCVFHYCYGAVFCTAPLGHCPLAGVGTHSSVMGRFAP